jgi:hypothetical protein
MIITAKKKESKKQNQPMDGLGMKPMQNYAVQPDGETLRRGSGWG